MDRIGPSEIIVIALLVLIVFGSKRLPDVARSLGRSARVFKSEVDEMNRESQASTPEAAATTMPSDLIEPAEATDTTQASTPTASTMATTGGNAGPENAPPAAARTE